MSATANPYFESQQRALQSLRRVHQICLVLQVIHVVASVLVLFMGLTLRKELLPDQSLMTTLHMYAAMMYFFLAVFAHVVVFYVLFSIGQNVRSAERRHPGSVDPVLLHDSGKLQNKLVPWIAAHSVFLVLSVALSRSSLHFAIACAAAMAGAVCVFIVRRALKTNHDHMTTFMNVNVPVAIAPLIK